jgi:hypothetical protein
MSWHNTAKSTGSAVEVNAAVVRWRTASLPGEISIARGRESDSAVRSNALGDDREVSRGHSTGDVNRGAKTGPFKLRNPSARSGKDQTDTMSRPGHPPATTSPALAVGVRSGNRSWAEKESSCVSIAVPQGEAAHVLSSLGVTCNGRNRRATDPYGRWCGGPGLQSPAYPIMLLHILRARHHR